MSKPLRDARHGQLQAEGNPVKLQQLRYIVEVASCGSVTRRDTRLSRYGKAFIEAICTHIP